MSGDASGIMLGGAQSLLTLLGVLAMSYFAFVTWRSGVGRLAVFFLVAILVEAGLAALGVVMQWAGLIFAYTSGTEQLWTMLHAASTYTWMVRTVAWLVAAVAFLLLALRVKEKSRRA